MKSRYIQYYVEGEDEVKLLNTLKGKMELIRPGKVQKLNATTCLLTDARLRALSQNTMVVLIFDTDAGNPETLKQNLDKLKHCTLVSEIVTIPQVRNLEEELLRSCKIHTIQELLKSKSRSDFKYDLIHVSNLDCKLIEHGFQIARFWSGTPTAPYQSIKNLSAKIKV